jgi:hypothetical protein
MRRLTAAIASTGLVLAGCTVATNEGNAEVSCTLGEDTVFVLVAQAVPTATLVPCILEFPAGWSYGGSDVRRGLARYWLSSDRAGVRSVEIALSPSCDVTGLEERVDPATELGVRVYQEPLSYPTATSCSRAGASRTDGGSPTGPRRRPTSRTRRSPP